MKEILEVIIKNIVENCTEMSIIEEVTENSIILKVKVAKEDMGRVIGKQGRVAKSIRTLMKSFSSKEGKRVNIEFLD